MSKYARKESYIEKERYGDSKKKKWLKQRNGSHTKVVVALQARLYSKDYQSFPYISFFHLLVKGFSVI